MEHGQGIPDFSSLHGKGKSVGVGVIGLTGGRGTTFVGVIES